jgi:tetratricopeptide (TPR) repeat protein
VGKYEQALAIFRQLEYLEGISAATSNLGIVDASWGQFDKAIENFQSSLTILRNLKDKSGEASSLSYMGTTYAQMGQFAEALKHLQEACAINAEMGVPTAAGNNNIGNVYLDLGELDKAEPLIVNAGYVVSLGRLSLAIHPEISDVRMLKKIQTDLEMYRHCLELHHHHFL